MALVVCPECKREISEYAQFCPGCGCPSWLWGMNVSESSRKALAAKRETNPEILAKFAGDSSADVRLAVACNPNTSLRVLEKLATDKSDDVCFGVVKNPNFPPSSLKKLGINPEAFTWMEYRSKHR